MLWKTFPDSSRLPASPRFHHKILPPKWIYEWLTLQSQAFISGNTGVSRTGATGGAGGGGGGTGESRVTSCTKRSWTLCSCCCRTPNCSCCWPESNWTSSFWIPSIWWRFVPHLKKRENLRALNMINSHYHPFSAKVDFQAPIGVPWFHTNNLTQRYVISTIWPTHASDATSLEWFIPLRYILVSNWNSTQIKELITM